MSKGHIERLRGGSYRVAVHAGKDPITGRKHYMKETYDREADAEAARVRMLDQVEAEARPVPRTVRVVRRGGASAGMRSHGRLAYGFVSNFIQAEGALPWPLKKGS